MTFSKSPKLQRLRAPLSAAIVAVALGCSQSSEGCDFNSAHSFQIAASKLSESLLQIGRVSGCAVSFEPERTGDQPGPSISGKMTVREAMQQALAHSDLETVQTRNGTLTVRKRNGRAIPLAENQ